MQLLYMIWIDGNRRVVAESEYKYGEGAGAWESKVYLDDGMTLIGSHTEREEAIDYVDSLVIDRGEGEMHFFGKRCEARYLVSD